MFCSLSFVFPYTLSTILQQYYTSNWLFLQYKKNINKIISESAFHRYRIASEIKKWL